LLRLFPDPSESPDGYVTCGSISVLVRSEMGWPVRFGMRLCGNEPVSVSERGRRLVAERRGFLCIRDQTVVHRLCEQVRGQKEIETGRAGDSRTRQVSAQTGEGGRRAKWQSGTPPQIAPTNMANNPWYEAAEYYSKFCWTRIMSNPFFQYKAPWCRRNFLRIGQSPSLSDFSLSYLLSIHNRFPTPILEVESVRSKRRGEGIDIGESEKLFDAARTGSAGLTPLWTWVSSLKMSCNIISSIESCSISKRCVP
jgi:hypothetical protein